MFLRDIKKRKDFKITLFFILGLSVFLLTSITWISGIQGVPIQLLETLNGNSGNNLTRRKFRPFICDKIDQSKFQISCKQYKISLKYVKMIHYYSLKLGLGVVIENEEILCLQRFIKILRLMGNFPEFKESFLR